MFVRSSILMKTIRMRIIVLFAGTSLWLNKIQDIILEKYKTALGIKKDLHESYIQAKNFITESSLWGAFFENTSEATSGFEPLMIPYWIMQGVSIISIILIGYAVLYCLEEWFFVKGKNKKWKNFVYISILVFNITSYFLLIRYVYQP